MSPRRTSGGGSRRGREAGAAKSTPPRTTPLYVVDTSAWVRQTTEPLVRARVAQALVDGDIALVTPVVLELGYSARNPAEWDRLHTSLAVFPVLAPSARTHLLAVELQRALWHSGRLRAAGAFDTLIAALAIEHDATVLHYDTDYEHLAAADGRLAHEWVAPRGTLV